MSAKPQYQKLKEHIIRRISSGELKPADRVPSENELVEKMRVSRMTANRALRELTTEGYVERIVGRGTFVTDTRPHSNVLRVNDIADEVAERGHQHSCRVLQQLRQRVRDDVAEALHIEPGTAVFHLLLVHYEDGEPIQVEDRHVLASFAPDCLEQDFTAVTPSAYLTAIAPLQEAEQVVRASVPGENLRRRLRLQENEACLDVIRRTWVNGRPVTFARLHHPGDRFELTGRYTPPGTRPAATRGVADLEELPK